MLPRGIISRFAARFLLPALIVTVAIVVSPAQYRRQTIPPPPQPGITRMERQGIDGEGRQPSNITTEIIYDPATSMYYIHTRLGDKDLLVPYMLSADEYSRMSTRRDMADWFRRRNAMSLTEKGKAPFNVLDMNFASGALEKIFGPGGVRLTTRGSIQLSMGIKSNKTDNPALPIRSRRKTFFSFDQKIQANIGATVGDRLKFNMSYNTDATFDFDSKNLRLNYEGKEDDIIKSIEAGNVSMTTGSSLIRGGTALFGVKSRLQFGKLTLTGLLSQQNSESRTVSTQGGVQTTRFSIKADDYDANRHFFLSQYFYDNYDRFAARLPHVSSGITITRIEVWITNKNSNYNESRNFVAFMDMGENTRLANDYWRPNPAFDNPSNTSNNLLEVIKTQYPGARDINKVTQVLEPLAAYDITGGKDFEKVESARLLSQSEYVLNPTLGYISLRSAIDSDETLGVAYEYTYQGKVFQVGEFSSDISTTDESLYLKLLKGTTVSPALPMWRLMMKNVYSLGAYQLQKKNFRLDIKYLSDTTGLEINYLPEASISGKPLLQIMNLDRIDSNQESNPDGFFDYVEGYTVQPANGKIIFPVAEPFGSHLERQIGNPAIAAQYVYKELYDSTLTVARQFADKNKFSLTGEYQAAGGATIRLNAMNVPRGSVVVTAGGVVLTENSDYTVDYSMGIVTITNQSIIDSGTNVSVTLENQSLFSMQRKTLMGLDAQYRLNDALTFGGTVMNFSEKALTEKVNIGEEVVYNTMWGINLNYNKEFMWLTNLLNKVPTIDATAPSAFRLNAEFAQLVPHGRRSGSTAGSSYIDDFESTQTGIDLRNPYSWTLASTPYDPSADALFPEASLSDNVDYGKNRALLAWNYIDRMWTQKNSSLLPGYLRNDLKQLSNPYVREVLVREIYPGRDMTYGESNYIQTLNLSFYPSERGPYNLDADNIDENGKLLFPEKRWGGIMRKLDNTDFENSNVEYIEFWMLDPFLDPDADNADGGDLYFNFGEISEDILKDGMKSYENGIPVDGDDRFLKETVWGRVSTQNSLTYAFENTEDARLRQDVGLDGLPNDDEYAFSSYHDYLDRLRTKLSGQTLSEMDSDPFSPMNDPAGDNYHFYRSDWYDTNHTSILDRYKRYNGVEGNSLSPDQSDNRMYQSSRSVPDVEDINQDNTLSEYERYFQYKISVRPEDLQVGRNYVTDRRETVVPTREGNATTVWYQFKIPLSQPDKVVGSIRDFSTIRFMRMFMTGFKAVTHLRFASLELVRGEWRDYAFSLDRGDESPAEGELDMSIVNIEENYGRKPVNYVLPPDVSRIQDPSQMQATQLNEQSLSMKVTGLRQGASRAAYKNTQIDLRQYRRLQMWVHAEALIDDPTHLRDGDLCLFLRIGSDVKNNYYEYEIPLELTPPGVYNYLSSADREAVWPLSNFLNIPLEVFTSLKTRRNRERSEGVEGVGYNRLFTGRDPGNDRNTVSVLGNPSLSDIRVMMIGVRNRSNTMKDGTVWVNELRVTDFNESGGWAAKVNANLAMSDIAMLNFAMHKETAGFGSVDQGLSSRRIDDYEQFDFALQGDMGKIFPKAAKLTAPVYYSRSSETVTPKYNPLDQDILLKDAVDAAKTRHEKDSIKSYAVTHTTVESFSLSSLKFNVRSKNPMPWDPANLQLSFSFNKQRLNDPNTEYRRTNDYRGSLQYSYSPYIRPLRPFGSLKGKDKTSRFFREWGINWFPDNISFFTNISRYYYEEQTRSKIDAEFSLPVQVSKNFLWDRQLNVTWNILQSLSLTFASNTTARIEETVGAVNKRLFPDKYRDWRDTVWSSIKGLGTPWNYNQTFTGIYRAPFSKIPAVDYLSGSVGYNSTYRWDKGATVDELYTGNSIRNQSVWNADARLNFETLFNKSEYLRKINRRFSKTMSGGRNGTASRTRAPRARRLERAVTLLPDTTTIIRHNLNTEKIRISAIKDGKPFKIESRPVDDNSVEILTKGSGTIRLTISEDRKEPQKSLMSEFRDHALRFLMMPRSLSFRWRGSHSLSLPQFSPNIGDVFGQSNKYGPMAPGLGFAFGFFDESYVDKALERGWLLTSDEMTSPAIWNKGKEFNFELTLEPARGLRIVLTSNLTDNRTKQIQFMFAGMPTSLSGSYTRTHVALASALRSSNASDGYSCKAFSRFLSNIPIVAGRLEQAYGATRYPSGGALENSPLQGTPYNPAVGEVSPTSPDVLIPAFIAAYSGYDAHKVTLSHFPGLGSMRPNWRVTYDGLLQVGGISKIFKAFTLSHAYQCTYSVGGYSSYLDWMGVGGEMGFIIDELSGQPMPSSPYSISSVAITEKFAPLIGVNMTFRNDITLNAEYRDARTLNLNSAAGQLVETSSRQLSVGAGWKIADFNKILRWRKSKEGESNDLSMNLDLALSNNQALIRRIETDYTQPTNGTRTFSVNFMASYQMSRKITVSAFFDHQVNTPLVSNTSFPTTNSNYGIAFNISLAR